MTMVTNLKLSWLLLAFALLATQVFAKDFQITLWNSTDCTRADPSTESIILQIPRDNDDPSADITCANLKGLDFNGWIKDTHGQQVIAYVDTLALDDGCEFVFYNQGPPVDQPREQIATGTCWQAYRKVNSSSACPSVSFNPKSISVSLCCGDICQMSRGYNDITKPAFPAAPQLSNDLPNLFRDLSQNHRINSRSPLQGDHQTSSRDLSKCQFKNSTLLRTTYLPSVQTDNWVPCPSGSDTSGAACTFEATFTSEVQLMTAQSLSISESIQSGIEGLLAETTTFAWDGSSSATSGLSISNAHLVSLPEGRQGYPTFKQAVKCMNGTWAGCDVEELISLPDQEYCIPILTNITSESSSAVGVFAVVDIT
ncbi:hypothetical protein F5Y01DRAFT_298036 [Xylaria sp. FL0043]|nr:hypothetical protein F5Y01DRAFT_298036 [Xylaria sp. FL0043]